MRHARFLAGVSPHHTNHAWWFLCNINDVQTLSACETPPEQRCFDGSIGINLKIDLNLKRIKKLVESGKDFHYPKGFNDLGIRCPCVMQGCKFVIGNS